MTKRRRQFSAKFKFQVALEALKEQKTISEIASQYEVHPTQVKQWKSNCKREELMSSMNEAGKQQKQIYVNRLAALRWN